MKIMIPMAGLGKRFLAAGITTPKPLLPVEGMPVIEHIIHNFSFEDDFVFGVNEDHLKHTQLGEVLQRLAPRASVVSMPYHKAGPIGVLRNMFPHALDQEPVIVNYCDFSWAWDYQDFKKTVAANGCDGAVVCYRGFHPHLVGPNLYATLDAEGLWMKAIQEKHTWHGDKMKDWTSSGTYYFKNAGILKKACREIEKHPDWKINGEFYVSQLYQVMKDMGLKIFIYEIPFMLQWGTPEDMEEYNYWSDIFRAKARPGAPAATHRMNVLTLMAGAGKRFSDAGYTLPKPLIPVDGKPMAVCAAQALPPGDRYFFLSRREGTNEPGRVEPEIKKYFPGARFLWIDRLTEGQAATALLAKGLVPEDEPLLIGACDHGLILDQGKFDSMTAEGSGTDALIFTYRHYPPVRRNPKAYGWVETGGAGAVRRVSVKVPLEGDPALRHAISGAFWFRRAGIFFAAAEQMIREDDRVNNEFYIDQAMNHAVRAGHKVKVFEAEKHVGWGTPDDLRTYEYWQRFFSQAWFHPYAGAKTAHA
ncbi:MAG TPA: NTP transferase domain-containing protein [Verrucomicrobiae bacterium]|jgi:NDP-sugar pyrophosphorylase family protein|nr:NTP transferase domain-containing protein [Verrucomicrobiae bacterium]